MRWKTVEKLKNADLLQTTHDQSPLSDLSHADELKLHQRVQQDSRLIYALRWAPHQKSVLLSGKNVLTKDRYYLPSRDLGSLMTIAISIFYQNQLSSIESRRNLMNCFTITLGEVKVLVFSTETISCWQTTSFISSRLTSSNLIKSIMRKSRVATSNSLRSSIGSNLKEPKIFLQLSFIPESTIYPSLRRLLPPSASSGTWLARLIRENSKDSSSKK